MPAPSDARICPYRLSLRPSPRSRSRSRRGHGYQHARAYAHGQGRAHDINAGAGADTAASRTMLVSPVLGLVCVCLRLHLLAWLRLLVMQQRPPERPKLPALSIYNTSFSK